MRLVRHLVRHDLTADAKILIVWVAVLALQSTVLWIGPPEPVAGFSDTVRLDVVSTVLRLALTVFMVAALIHRHPLVGTTAFWRTRPLPRGTLLVAKFTSIVLMAVILPAAWLCVTFIGLGCPLGPALKGAAAVALEQAIVLGFGWALAALTANSSQLVLSMIVSMVTAGVTFGLARRRGPVGPSSFAITIHDGDIVEIVLLCLVVLLLVGVAAYQHLALKRWRGVAVAALAMAAMAGVLRYPTWRVVEAPVDETLAGLPRVAPGSFDMTTLKRNWRKTGDAESMAYSAVVRNPLQQTRGLVLAPVAGSATLTYDTGAPVEYAQQPGSLTLDWSPAAPQPFAALSESLGTALVTGPESNGYEYRVVLFQVPMAVYRSRERDAGLLRVRQQCSAMRFNVEGAVRLGERYATSRGSVELEDRTATADGVAAVVRETAYLRNWTIDPSYHALRNESSRQSVLLNVMQQTEYRSTMLTRRGVTVTRRQLEATLPRDAAPLAADIGKWLLDAELVWLEGRVVGRTEWSVQLPRFVLGDAGGEAGTTSATPLKQEVAK